MKEDGRKINNDATKAEGIRLEYQMLREQITYSDNVCVMIMGFLLATTTTLASFTSKNSTRVTAFILPTLWLIGFLYFSEKRFVIKKTAYYIKTELEERDPGLGWQYWNSGDIAEKFLHISPYVIETGISGLIIIINPFFVAYMLNLDCHDLLFWALLAISTVFLIVITKISMVYSKLEK